MWKPPPGLVRKVERTARAPLSVPLPFFMAGNKNLHTAARAKKDEFYTRLSDIENEVRHYRHHFAGKTVLCNCDDPYESNFFKYFALNFRALGLKRLVCTCYNGSPVSGSELTLEGFGFEPEREAYKVVINEIPDANGDGAVDLSDVRCLLQSGRNVLTTLETGDFRSAECVELLKEADIVVTNPPFSLFREYIAQIMRYEKKFLVIGNQNAITYKEIFPLIKDNRLWLGYHSGHTLFDVPSYYGIPDSYDKSDHRRLRSNGYILDADGRLRRNLGCICWFTNLDIPKRHEDIILYKTYTPEEYPTYDNRDAINVDKVAEIPADYNGECGVPITFLEKFNPEQFEITRFRKGDDGKDLRVNGKCPYYRILIRRKR